MTITDGSRRNGVDTATLFATLDAVKGQNEIATFQFRVSNTWVSGTHSRTISDRGPPWWSTCCTPSPPASPPASPTLRSPELPRIGAVTLAARAVLATGQVVWRAP